MYHRLFPTSAQLSPWRRVALNDRCVVAVKADITSSITTVLYMLGHRTGFISCIVSSSVLGLSATFTVSHIAFHFVANAAHLACCLGTPRTAGWTTRCGVRSTRCRGGSELLIYVCPSPAASNLGTADTLPSSNTGWVCQLSLTGTFSWTVPLSTVIA